jgi:hypothetical protein
MKTKTSKPKPGGRPPGVTMPCGWQCGRQLTASQMRAHFTDCPRRPVTMRERLKRKMEEFKQELEMESQRL